MAHSERTLRAITGAAMGASTALTGAAFWLSYQYLQELAASHGLRTSPVRSWVWPGTIDLFIVIGELLCLRAAFTRTVDKWAIALTAFGGVASIGLNIVSVGRHAHPLEYVVHSTPSVAALLGFGVIMQAVHRMISDQPTDQDTPHREQPAEQPTAHAEQPEAAPVSSDQPTLFKLPDDLVSTEEAMSILGVSRATFGRYTSTAKGEPRLTARHVDASNRKHYSRADVHALLKTG